MKTLMLKALVLAVLATGTAKAADVVAVLSGDSGPYKEALEGLKAVVGTVEAVTLPNAPKLDGAKVVVTFGSEAALKKYPDSVALVAALMPDPKILPKHGGSVTRVGLVAAPGVLAAKIKSLQGAAATLAVLDPAGAYGDYIAALKAVAPNAGLAISVKKVDSLSDLATKLPGLKGSAQALWMPPDPLFMNPKTFSLIAQFCRGAGIGMYAPMASLAKLGSLAGISPSFKAQGRAAGLAAQAYAGGGQAEAWVYADKVDFTANKTVAAELGVGAAALGKADSTVE